jgi:peptide deformylase
MRPKKIKVNFLDIDAKNVTMYLEDFEARIFQHEFDHLDGITFDTRVSKLKLQMAKDKQKKLEKRHG